MYIAWQRLQEIVQEIVQDPLWLAREQANEEYSAACGTHVHADMVRTCKAMIAADAAWLASPSGMELTGRLQGETDMLNICTDSSRAALSAVLAWGHHIQRHRVWMKAHALFRKHDQDRRDTAEVAEARWQLYQKFGAVLEPQHVAKREQSLEFALFGTYFNQEVY